MSGLERQMACRPTHTRRTRRAGASLGELPSEVIQTSRWSRSLPRRSCASPARSTGMIVGSGELRARTPITASAALEDNAVGGGPRGRGRTRRPFLILGASRQGAGTARNRGIGRSPRSPRSWPSPRRSVGYASLTSTSTCTRAACNSMSNRSRSAPGNAARSTMSFRTSRKSRQALVKSVSNSRLPSESAGDSRRLTASSTASSVSRGSPRCIRKSSSSAVPQNSTAQSRSADLSFWAQPATISIITTGHI